MESFINMLNDTLHMNGQLFCFLVSLFPILELRGGLIAAALCKVGIPLPVTGAWTGGLVAGLFDFSLKQTFIATILGLCMSATIMTIITYGIPWIVTTFNIPSSVVVAALCGIVAVVIGIFVVRHILKKKKTK